MRRMRRYCGILILTAVCLVLTSCKEALRTDLAETQQESIAEDRQAFLKIAVDEPDTVDFHCTSGDYDIALNVFDRLVAVQTNEDGTSEIIPSLADSWEVSEDGLIWVFHLHEQVEFSNGAALTSEDVLYSFSRLLTHQGAVNHDIILDIEGAQALHSGEKESLEGFEILDDYTFRITLTQPNAAFLACLSTPGASIMDSESAKEAQDRFGSEAEYTIGTGPFILDEWNRNIGMILKANPDCWSGAPKCEGIQMIFLPDPETQRLAFERGELDILDLDNIGSEAEYIVHGDIYQDHLQQGPRVGITYLALNEEIPPLNDVNVRKALMMALDRQALLEASCGGRGEVENGIFPHGLIGFNPDLPEIAYDPVQARELLLKASGPSARITISVSTTSQDNVRELLTLVAYMWEKIGINVQIEEIDEDEFMEKRKSGQMACYTSSWSADFNDPDNFIYTFFGSLENTKQRSLNYQDTDTIERVHTARAITGEEERIAEYQELERKIVQEDAAWIPLYSRYHIFALNERVKGFKVSWNGWSCNQYRDVYITGP